MIDARITELRFKPGPGSRWAALRVGMTLDDAVHALGDRRNDRGNLYYRARCGEIVFDLPLPQRGVVASDISDVDTGRGVEEPPRRTVTRPCLCCRQPFQSEGPGNRLCDGCRGRNVSPFEPG
jgi:hypothetical protein